MFILFMPDFNLQYAENADDGWMLFHFFSLK